MRTVSTKALCPTCRFYYEAVIPEQCVHPHARQPTTTGHVHVTAFARNPDGACPDYVAGMPLGEFARLRRTWWGMMYLRGRGLLMSIRQVWRMR